MSKHSEDGKFVVVEGNQRVTGNLHETQQAAQSEADASRRQRPVTEGQPVPSQPKVVQNLLG